MEFNHNEIQADLIKLQELGFNVVEIQNEFLINKGKYIKLNETMKVRPENEGEFIKFEAFDKTSIIIPYYKSVGSWNKLL